MRIVKALVWHVIMQRKEARGLRARCGEETQVEERRMHDLHWDAHAPGGRREGRGDEMSRGRAGAQGQALTCRRTRPKAAIGRGAPGPAPAVCGGGRGGRGYETWSCDITAAVMAYQGAAAGRLPVPAAHAVALQRGAEV